MPTSSGSYSNSPSGRRSRTRASRRSMPFAVGARRRPAPSRSSSARRAGADEVALGVDREHRRARAARRAGRARSNGGAGASAAGCRWSTTSMRARAPRARARACAPASGRTGSSRPGRSWKMNWVSPSVRRPATGSRVAWALRAHDGEVLADEGVEQRGLADVGGAGEGDVAGSGHGGSLGGRGGREAEAGSGPVVDRAGECDATKKPRQAEPGGASKKRLATAYSPTISRWQYHRRCRA